MDTIIELSVNKKNLSLAKNLKLPKYTNGYSNNNKFIDNNTAINNYGIIINSTKVPVIDNNNKSIKMNNSTVIIDDNTKNSLSKCKNIICNTCKPTKTSTVRCNNVKSCSRPIATSLTELKVDINCVDTRRASSEPGSLSTTTVINGQRAHMINQPQRETTASRIASLDRLDKIVNDKIHNNYGINKNSHLNSLITSPTCSTISVLSKNKLSSNFDSNNTTGENESDYVVDPVHGNAYLKGQFLGKGGFARVYLMTDITNGKRYACKIIPKNRMQKIHIQKIAREIMIHKDLNHINVVQMHHYFENSLNVYMLLEACPKKSLMHVLKYRGKVTEPEARYYMKQMVTGVAYIHSQKVVHRDLKPGNMFLSDGMIVKIGDFGLATRPDGQRRRVTICGTPNYIAPEVLYKQAYSYEADVWALGCILYALLAGQPPFDTATLKETYSRICNNRYKKLNDTIVTKNGQDLIKWLLQPIPELRPSLETVKDHPYLSREYVPDQLAHSCSYKPPDIDPQGPISDKKLKTLAPTASFPSATSLSSTSCTSTASRRIVRSRINEDAAQSMIKHLETTTIPNGLNTNVKLTNNINIRPLLNSTQKETKKKSKVGNWLVRKFPKLTKLRQRIGNFLCPDRKKSSDSALMHHALENCLAEIKHTRAPTNPSPIDGVVPLFVTKWIDYSNKYGLCFQLSDRSVGVLFNDSTKMSYTRDRRRVEYTNPEDEVTRYARERDVPSSMHEKLELLRHFTEYMDDHLTNGGEIGDNCTTKLARTNGNVPRMRRWLRTDKAIVMELTVPLLQVNFFSDHTKIVVSEGSRPRDYLVTYIDANRQAITYWLNDIRDCGCTMELYERLNYVCKASREFAHLENNIGCSEISVNCRTNLRS